MIRIADLLDPLVPTEHWQRLKQVGVNDVVTLLDSGEQLLRWPGSGQATLVDLTGHPDGPAWSRRRLERLKSDYADAGLVLAAIEDTPPMDAIRLGGPGRDRQMDDFCELIRAMGALDIPVLCYNWIAVDSWARTRPDMPARGGALVTEYDHHLAAGGQARPRAACGEEQLWSNFEWFIERAVPVAEQSGVRLALHPDDPPISPVRGVPRIMCSVAAFERVVQTAPSECNGITLCQGNFALLTDDLPALIRRFGAERLIHYVHFRDVRGTPEHFVETFHDDGPTDMLACLEAYAEIGYDGVLRPDHVPTLSGELNDRPGYALAGRLHAIGYVEGLLKAVYRDEAR